MLNIDWMLSIQSMFCDAVFGVGLSRRVA